MHRIAAPDGCCWLLQGCQGAMHGTFLQQPAPGLCLSSSICSGRGPVSLVPSIEGACGDGLGKVAAKHEAGSQQLRYTCSCSRSSRITQPCNWLKCQHCAGRQQILLRSRDVPSHLRGSYPCMIPCCCCSAGLVPLLRPGQHQQQAAVREELPHRVLLQVQQPGGAVASHSHQRDWLVEQLEGERAWLACRGLQQHAQLAGHVLMQQQLAGAFLVQQPLAAASLQLQRQHEAHDSGWRAWRRGMSRPVHTCHKQLKRLPVSLLLRHLRLHLLLPLADCHAPAEGGQQQVVH